MSFEDDAAKFFAGETEKSDRELQVELFSSEMDGVILDALDRHGAVHIWHPDEEVEIAVINETVEGLIEKVEQEDIKSDIAPVKAVVDMARKENEIVAQIKLIKSIEKFASEEGDIRKNDSKKRLLATLQLLGFDEGWIKASAEVLETEPLDLTKEEEDLQIYIAETNEHGILAKPDPVVEALTSIVLAPLLDRNSKEYAIAEGSVSHLSGLMVLSEKNSEKKVEAEAYIDEMFRNGLINESQVAQLKELLA